MRAVEISLFLIFLSASIGLMNGIGVFDSHYGYEERAPYMFWSVSNLTQFQDENPSLWDQVVVYVQFTIQAIFWIATILFTVIAIYPALVNTFHVPAALSILLQIGLWAIYIIGYVQWKRGASIEGLR